MARILYSAKTPNGKATSGLVKADSNDAALQILSGKGYTEIQFYSSNDFQGPNAYARLDKMDPQEIRDLSRHIIRNQTRSPRVRKLVQLFKFLEVPLSLGFMLVVMGFIFSSQKLELAGIISVPLLFAILYFPRRNLANLNGQYMKVKDLISHGQFQQAEKLNDKLLANKPSAAQKVVEPELIAHKAYLIARRQNLDKGMAYLESMKHRLKELPAWRYDNIRGRLYIAVGDFQNYLKQTREAHDKAPDNQILILDLAAAETRWGELDAAKQLLRSVNISTLPQFALPFVDLVKGLIAERSHDNSRLEHFSKAYEGQMKFRKNTNTLQILAMMAGHYGLALLDAGNADLAEKIVQEHWDVLRNSTDDALLQKLKTGIPALNNT